MWKQLAVIAVLIGALTLPTVATAQDGTFRVWQALTTQDTDAITAQAREFAAQSGSELELVYVDGALLLDSLLQANNAGTTPDVIFSNNSNALPLLQSDLLATDTLSQQFFLEELLTNFPDLAQQLCGDDALETCLWPDANTTFTLITPQTRTMSQATSVLCKASSWLPLCNTSQLTMAPLGWDFDLYLINSEWMAENGIDNPVSSDDVLDLRSDYAIRLTAARTDTIPTATEANHPAMFVLSSTLLKDDPEAVMASLASFQAEDYYAVVALNIYGVYISASAQHRDQAREFASALMNDTDAKIALMDPSGHVPALTPDELTALDQDDPIVAYTMQTLALLTTYTTMY